MEGGEDGEGGRTARRVVTAMATATIFLPGMEMMAAMAATATVTAAKRRGEQRRQ